MKKGHKKFGGGICYSTDVVLQSTIYVHTFSCGFCHTSWRVPVGPTATFVNGVLVRATDAGVERSPERIKEMNENIRWSIEYLQQFVENVQQTLF